MEEDKLLKVTHKAQQQGKQEPILNHQEVTFQVRICKNQVDDGILHKAILGKQQLQKNIEDIVLQMRKGDRWTISKAEANQTFIIEIVDVGPIVDVRPAVEKAEVQKIQGNDKIKQKDYRAAIEIYQKAYNLIEYSVDPKAQELKLSIVSNLALATLNGGEFSSCIGWCNKHLEETLDPNLKIVYRKANANKAQKCWEEAKKDIEFGIRNCGNDSESLMSFKQLITLLEKQEKEQKLKQKSVYGKMFK